MRLLSSSVHLSVWDVSVLWPNGLDDRVEFFLAHNLPTATVTMCSGAGPPAAEVWSEVSLIWPKMCLRIDVQYLGNAA